MNAGNRSTPSTLLLEPIAVRSTAADVDAPVEQSSETATPLRLLHVEDNFSDALLMQEYIKGILAGVTFDTAARMSELTPARANDADCALLDLSLPDASGLESLMTLREMSPDLPIIVLTGFDDLAVGLSSLRYGADDYLVKNQVDGLTLDRAVRYAIERRRLTTDVTREASAATVATADVIAAQAALEGLTVSMGELGLIAGSMDTLSGTHQVAVRISDETGEYALSCESCGWEAERGDEEMHSWKDRSLGWILLRHVAFGDTPDAASKLPAPQDRATGTDGGTTTEEDSAPEPAEPVQPFERRGLVSLQKWLQRGSAGRRDEQ